jgi:hypothetical protein
MAAETAVDAKFYAEAPEAIKSKLKSTNVAEFKAAQSSVDFIQKNIAAQKLKYMNKGDEEKE